MIIAAMLLAAAPAPADHLLVRAKLDRIADRCHLQRKVFQVSPTGSVHFRPPHSNRYEDVDCALEAMKQEGLTSRLPFAFVGSEAYEPERKPQ